ncbi:hypothetical protein [Paenibacillus sp. GCM10028914]|uniref:hypothetical protein n=1 Tax=Paenibacillus sp. GCM10028914 TaxID=3273416 RepID=UPI00360614BA
MRISPKFANCNTLSLIKSGSVRETESLSRSIVLPVDPLWKMDVKASERVYLPRR